MSSSPNQPSPRQSSDLSEHWTSRLPRDEVEEYIDYLESQLTAASTTDSFTSPAVVGHACQKEVKLISREPSGCKKTFVERVEEEFEHYARNEAELRLRLQMLEDEVESQDLKMKELQSELEIVRPRLKEAEDLQLINLNLAKMIKVLISPLLVSEKKIDQSSTPFPPNKTDTLKSPGELPLRADLEDQADSATRKHICNLGSSPSTPDQSSHHQSTNWIRHESYEQLSTYQLSLSSDMSFDIDESKSSESPEPRRQPMGLDKELPLALAQSPDSSQDGPIPAAEVEAHEQLFAHELSLISEMNFDPDESESSESSEPRRQPLSLDKELALALAQSPDPSQDGLIYAAEVEADERFSAHQLSLSPDVDFDPDESKSSETSEPRLQPLTLDKELALALAQSPDPTQVHGLIAAAETEAEIDLEVVPIEPDHAQYDITSLRPCMRQNWWTTNSELTPQKDTTYSHMEISPGVIPPSPTTTMNAWNILTWLTSLISRAKKTPAVLARWFFYNAYEIATLSPFIRRGSWTTNRELTSKQDTTYSQMDFAPRVTPSGHPTTTNAWNILTKLTSLISRAKQAPAVLARRFFYNAWTFGSVKVGGLAWWLLGLGFRSHRQTRPCAANAKAHR